MRTRKLGEPLLELRALRVEPREALAYPLRLPGTGIRLGHPALQGWRRLWVRRTIPESGLARRPSGAAHPAARIIHRRASSFRCRFQMVRAPARMHVRIVVPDRHERLNDFRRRTAREFVEELPPDTEGGQQELRLLMGHLAASH